MQFPKFEKSKETLKIKLENSLLDIKKTNNSILKYIKRNVEVDSKLSQSLSNSKTPFKKSFADSLQELNKNIKGFLIGTSEGESKSKSNILGFLKDVVGKGLQFIITHPELLLTLGVGVVADLLYNYIKTNGGKIWQSIKAKISKDFEKVIQSLKDSLTNISIKFKEIKKNVTNILKNVPFVYDKVKPLLEESDDSNDDNTKSSIPNIKPVGGNITSGYGMRMHPILKTPKFHSGIDFAAAEGTKVRATADGEVTFSGFSNGYGLKVVISNESGFSTVYAHLSKSLVQKGQRGQRGEVIALSGNTGLSTGPHLHYEIHKNKVNVNPIDYFSQNLESILKQEMKDVLSTDKDFLKRPQKTKNFQVAKTDKTPKGNSTNTNDSISHNNFVNTSNYYENRSNSFYQDSINYHNVTTQEFVMNTEETNNSFVNVNMPVTNSINIIKATKQPHEFLKYA